MIRWSILIGRDEGRCCKRQPGDVGGRYVKNCSNHCGGRLQRHTRPSLFNQERKVISNSIIFFVGRNSEQMVTIATGLIAISTHCRRLFFGTNLPWLHEVFTQEVKLANRSMALETWQTSKECVSVKSLLLYYLPVLPFALPLCLISGITLVLLWTGNVSFNFCCDI